MTAAPRIPLTEAEIAEARRLDDLGVSRPEIARLLTTTLARVDRAIGSLSARAERRARERRRIEELRAVRDSRQPLDAPPTEPSMRDLLRAPVPVVRSDERLRQAGEIYRRLEKRR